ncbi:hypothetical protein D3C85_1486880 [compost metagenome]
MHVKVASRLGEPFDDCLPYARRAHPALQKAEEAVGPIPVLVTRAWRDLAQLRVAVFDQSPVVR